jgi:hypothetical protein
MIASSTRRSAASDAGRWTPQWFERALVDNQHHSRSPSIEHRDGACRPSHASTQATRVADQCRAKFRWWRRSAARAAEADAARRNRQQAGATAAAAELAFGDDEAHLHPLHHDKRTIVLRRTQRPSSRAASDVAGCGGRASRFGESVPNADGACRTSSRGSGWSARPRSATRSATPFCAVAAFGRRVSRDGCCRLARANRSCSWLAERRTTSWRIRPSCDPNQWGPRLDAQSGEHACAAESDPDGRS